MLPQGNTDCLSGFSRSKWEDILGENCEISGRPSTLWNRGRYAPDVFSSSPYAKPGLLRAAFEKPDNANGRTIQDHVATRTGWFKLRVRQCSNCWHLKSYLWPFTIINSLISPLWVCTVSEKEITVLLPCTWRPFLQAIAEHQSQRFFLQTRNSGHLVSAGNGNTVTWQRSKNKKGAYISAWNEFGK